MHMHTAIEIGMRNTLIDFIKISLNDGWRCDNADHLIHKWC